MSNHPRLGLLCAGLLLAGTLFAHPLPQRSAQGLLVSASGQTLYAYDPDGSSGKSACSVSKPVITPLPKIKAIWGKVIG